MCDTMEAAVLLVEPSPKSQETLVIVPVEVLVRVTCSGATPLVGPPVKKAVGMTAATPVTGLVLLPLLPVAKRTTLLKLASLVGLKRTTTFVEPKPGKLNGLPERIVNSGGPGLSEAVPLLKVASPRLVTKKLAWTEEPTATVPKSRPGGETASCAGVRPEPTTGLVEFPPLLVNTTTLLKLAALPGAKLTST